MKLFYLVYAQQWSPESEGMKLNLLQYQPLFSILTLKIVFPVSSDGLSLEALPRNSVRLTGLLIVIKRYSEFFVKLNLFN